MKRESKTALKGSEAVTERAENEAPKNDRPVPLKDEPVSKEGIVAFDVLPSELVSIIADNRLLLLDNGVTEITVKYLTGMNREG